ncbi:MAG: xanthine dehydrogenase family protein subunit M [Thermoanaerobacteraceae bacterium]|nr:xanthine dehydrogenase family protein subunit M [Thermoanaerobacteraceae bacterium]
MKEFDYFRPSSLDECLKLLDQMRGRARILAGGTDLLVRLKHDMIREDNIVDIGRLDELHGVHVDGGDVHIAPLTTHNEIVESGLCDEVPVLKKACAQVGSPQIRNRGTIGGNVVNASPAGDTIPALSVHGAHVKLKSIDGERTIPIEELFTGPGRTAMRDNEILVDIVVPTIANGEIGFFKKLGQRNAMAISIVNIAVILSMNRSSKIIERAAVAVGSAAPTVIRCIEVENLMAGSRIDSAERLWEIAMKIRDRVSPISDVRASARYRAEMSANLFYEGMLELGVI